MLPPNQPLTKDAARKLMALDVQDKEILTYEKLDEWYTAWGGQCYVSFSGGKDSTVLAYLALTYSTDANSLFGQGQHGAGVSGGVVPVEFQDTAVGVELGVCKHRAGVPGDTAVCQ